MDLIAQIQEALAERLINLVIGRIELTLRTHPLDGFPERICEMDVRRTVRDRSPLFSAAEIASVFPTESRRRIALTLLGPCSVMAHIPIGALLSACGGNRLEGLVEACRQAAVYIDRRLSLAEEIDLMLLYMLQTGQLRLLP